jgi:hypothetical membrane protein
MSGMEKLRKNKINIFAVLAKVKNRIYDAMMHPKTVIISTIAAMAVFLPAITIGYFVAQLDPDGYNIIDNFISDLGSFNHTPNPIFLDYGAMITAFLLIVPAFYLDGMMAPYSRDPNNRKESSRLRLRLASYALFFMLVGLIGLFGIGFFSEDRSRILEPWGVQIGLHGPFSYVVFGGLILAGIFGGFLLFIYHPPIYKLMGLYMVFIPPIPAILFIIGYAPSAPYWEWMMLFAIMGWLIPAGLVSIKRALDDLKSR